MKIDIRNIRKNMSLRLYILLGVYLMKNTLETLQINHRTLGKAGLSQWQPHLSWYEATQGYRSWRHWSSFQSWRLDQGEQKLGFLTQRPSDVIDHAIGGKLELLGECLCTSNYKSASCIWALSHLSHSNRLQVRTSNILNLSFFFFQFKTVLILNNCRLIEGVWTL